MPFAAQIHPAEASILASTLFFKYVTSLVAQIVKCLSTMKETRIQSLGWEDPLEKGLATTPVSCLENSMGRGAWRFSTVQGSQRVGHD